MEKREKKMRKEKLKRRKDGRKECKKHARNKK